MATRNRPSQGGKPDKLMRDALMVALKREAKDAEGKPTKKLHIVASKLVDKAIEGDVQAIREIADRVDGKAAQSVQVSGEGGGPIEGKYTVEFVNATPKGKS